MECANRLCIYEKNGECILDKVTLDYDGRCEACIHVTVQEETLLKLKEEALKRE